MSNRRRSERYEVTIPVVIKGGRGAERTLSANISAHGIAVFSDRKLPVRQYVELELLVPPSDSKVSVTAMVARTTDALRDRQGGMKPGIAFDFYLFDTQGRATWRSFIEQLRAGQRPSSPEIEETTPAASTAPARPSGRFDDDVGTTFIVKPRDSQRLKNFLRTELSQGRVRIETPVLKPIGTAVEVLLVHPDTDVEWPLPGKVKVASETGRGRGPMLEVEIDELAEDDKRRFREFVETGRTPPKPQKPALAPRPVPTPPPANTRPSPSLSGSIRAPQPPPKAGLEEPSENDQGLETDLALLPAQRRAQPASQARPKAPPGRPASVESDEPRRRKPSEELPENKRPKRPSEEAPDPRRTRKPSEEMADPRRPKRPSEEAPDPRRPRKPSEEVEAPRRPRRPSEEAPDPRRRPEDGRVRDRTLEGPMLNAPAAPAGAQRGPDPITAPEGLPPPPPVPTAGAFASFFQEYSRTNEPEPGREPGFDDETETAPEQDAVPLAPGQRPKIPDAVSRPKPPDIPGASTSRGARSAPHSSISTESASPELDRQIALARARLVKTPESVQATLQLGRLLTKRKLQQSLEEAMVLFNRMVVSDPTNTDAHAGAAEVLLELGRVDEARSRLERVRQLGGRVDPELDRRITNAR